MRKHVNNHIGTVLVLIGLIVIGYLTSSGGLWLTRVYPNESEFIGIGLVAGFITYLLYRGVYNVFTIINHEHNH